MNASGRETVTRLRLPRIGLVQPLDDALYDRVYNNALFPNSTEYRRADGSEGPMISYVKEIVKRLNPKTVLSIGAGAANYDADLLSSANCYVENYLVMEPNPIHAKRVSENLKSNIVGKVTIIAEPFSTAFDLRKLDGVVADLIMFAHSLYFVTNPAEVIRHACALLAPNGTLVVQHQAHDTEIRLGFHQFSEVLGLEWDPNVPRQNHLITTQTISADLTKLGVYHTLHSEPAVIFVDSFHNNDDDTALLLLCFIMNTDVTKFPFEVRQVLQKWVVEHGRYNKHSGHFELCHPQGFIVLENASRTNLNQAINPL